MSEQTNGAPVARTSMDVLQSIEESLQAVVRTALNKVPARKQQSDDTKDLDLALMDAQKDFSDITKTGMIGGRNIAYAKISDLVKASRAALRKAKLVVKTYSRVEPSGIEILVTRLSHVPTGQYVESELSLLNNTDEQKRGSSITYAWRYTYAPLIGLVDDSCDDDGEMAKPTVTSYKR